MGLFEQFVPYDNITKYLYLTFRSVDPVGFSRYSTIGFCQLVSAKSSMEKISKFSGSTDPNFVINKSEGDNLVEFTLPQTSNNSSNFPFDTLYLEEI